MSMSLHKGSRPMDDPYVQLMERLRDGDDSALSELVERFQGELMGYFYHLCWDQARSEELTQDVFINVYRARQRYQPTAKVRTFLYRIAHNLWVDHLRRRRPTLSLDAPIGGSDFTLASCLEAPSDADPDRDQEIRQRVRQAVEELPVGQREVFVLANHEGMRYQEIGEVLGIPEGTVKSRMHHAVRALRTLLKDLIEP